MKTKTLVRLAYKAKQMGLEFDNGGIDPYSEPIAFSHVQKIREMKNWQQNPFANVVTHRSEAGQWICKPKVMN